MRIRQKIADAHETAVELSRGLPLWRRAVHVVALGILSMALAANWIHDVLWATGDRLGRWAHQ